MPGFREIYRGIRKSTPPPTKVDRDRRGRIRDKRDRAEMRRYERKRGGAGTGEDS